MLLKAVDIHKSYGSLKVLKGVSLEVARGEIVAVTGASGAGKSTLLHILGTLDVPNSGKVWIENTDVYTLHERELAAFRNKKIGFVFQFHHLLPEFTALENVIMPAMIGRMSEKEARSRAEHLLALLKMQHRMNHKPSELSGGEQQRVAVARALMNNPAIVLADEPSGNLDTANANSLHDLFFELRSVMNQTFLIVTHNNDLAAMADRIIHLKDGTIESEKINRKVS